MARLLLGVCGGIAAYRSLELARLATLAGHGVRVVMTANAKRFVGADSFEAVTGAPVLVSEFEPDPMRGGFPGEPEGQRLEHDPIGHLELAARADAFVVAPATANTIAKLATGQADSLLTTAFLACEKPRLVAPAMNDRMWNDEATAANVRTLASRGVTILGPGEGKLASRGEFGKGRMLPPEELLRAFEEAVSAKASEVEDLVGLRVLVSAGGTREPIDEVRFIGNRSSGKMGLAIANAAARRGADVTLVCANVAGEASVGVRRVDVVTAAELARTMSEEFGGCDILVMAAAVSDFTVANGSKDGKLERGGATEIALEPTEDILAGLASARTPGQTIVGFAAEHGDGGIERARQKRERKNVDLIAFNNISRTDIGFDSDYNEVTLIDQEGAEVLPKASKVELADVILDRIVHARRAI